MRRDFKNLGLLSLSARRAWIEIFVPFDVIRPAIVALRKESVDRNIELSSWGGWGARVALRKESVDRNTILRCLKRETLVALRKESVDRNTSIDNLTQGVFNVALRKESVDRNFFCVMYH